MRGSKMRGTSSLMCMTLLLLTMASDVGSAAEPTIRSRGQTVYAAAYSYVLMGTGKHKFLVASTLVIRNIDPVNTITVTTVDYRDSNGGHLRHYLSEPVEVAALASIEFVVQESDVTGGHSPSFIVQWRSGETVVAPVVETLVIGGRGGQGISFVGRAWVTEEAGNPQDE